MKETKYSGSWRMPDSARSIKHARRLRAGNRWHARIHGLLTVAIFLSLLAILTGVYLSLLCSATSDSKTAENCFTVAVCASIAFACCVLAKCWWNARHPLN